MPELDLHGVKHADVKVIVEDFVLTKALPIKIITGNSNPMKRLVVKVLDEHGYKTFDFFSACIIVIS